MRISEATQTLLVLICASMLRAAVKLSQSGSSVRLIFALNSI